MPDREAKIIKLRKLSQQLAYNSIQMHEAVGRKAGIAGTDHKYLGFLLQHGAMTAGEFSTLTGLTTGAVKSLIDRLEKKNLLKRQPDKADRRKVIIVPDTEKILGLLKPLYEDFQNNTDKLFGTFSSEDMKVLEKYLSDTIDLIKHKIQTLNQK